MTAIDDQERERAARDLLAALDGGGPLGVELRHAFGVLSTLHEQALREAVARGELDHGRLARLAWDRAGLGELSLRSTPLELRFDTTLGHGDQQFIAEVEPRLDEPVPLAGADGLRVRVSNAVELWRAAATATLEPETLDWLGSTIDASSVVYDVGANIGVISLLAWARGPARVVALEPEPLNYARLVENVALNADAMGSGDGGITTLPIAASDVEGLGLFHYRDFARGAASPDALATAGTRQTACVRRRLDNLCEDPVLDAPTHLKIDVDGHELQVLAGAERTLASAALRHVLIELQADDRSAGFRRLAEAGFRHVGGRVHGGGVGNYIFERW